MRSKWAMAAVAAAAGLVLMALQLPAGAQTTADPVNPVTGNATYFDALGAPYGGCGLPQAQLDSPHFVALNVYDTPRDYNFYPRPLTGADVSKMGMWNNGLNCGRCVQVSIGDYCNGVNDGAQNQAVLPQRVLGRRPVQRRHPHHDRGGQLRRLQRLVPRRPVPHGPGQGFAEPVRQERRGGRRHATRTTATTGT